MRPKVSDELREAVLKVVREPSAVASARGAFFRTITATEYNFTDVYADVNHFRYQQDTLSGRGVSQYVATFNDDGPNKDSLKVPIRVPDLQNIEKSYGRILDVVSKWNLPLDKIDAKNVEEVFVDRLSEFLAVRQQPNFSSTAITTVHSNRKGDTVLCAKGYFTSTGMGFGVSTPAKGYLKGRYSFGIVDNGMPRFYPVIWSCPTTATIKLP